MKSISLSIFRAYDIRGIVGETITEDSVKLIGQALGSMLRELGEDQMIIARDGRHSGPALLSALSEGLQSTGCDVIDIGMVPTPILYFATHVLHSNSGVMLTGSHNPASYNGLKMVIQGRTQSEADIQNIYHRIMEGNFAEGRGKKIELDLQDQYQEAICQQIKLQRPLKVVIDAGNGVAGAVAPELFKSLGCEVYPLFCDVDGTFPNHHPDPTQTENLQDLIHQVKALNADIGLAFDGDGDRLGIVTSQGDIIWPDRLLMLFAKHVLLDVNAEQDKPTIIYDVKCTNRLSPLIESLGGVPLMWKTGHSFIKAKMKETKAHLAGEMSGHFFFNDRWYGFDDALYAGARLLEILSQYDFDSAQVIGSIPNSVNTPELKVPVAEEEKFLLMQKLIDEAHFHDAKEILTIDGLRVNFQEGWGLVRPSNTTPYLIMRFEALNERILEKIQIVFRDWMLSVKPDLVLPF
jgi:phosphomannomutase/phosphoglucomutase